MKTWIAIELSHDVGVQCWSALGLIRQFCQSVCKIQHVIPVCYILLSLSLSLSLARSHGRGRE